MYAALSDVLSVWCWRSTNPLEWGEYKLVYWSLIPSFSDIFFHSSDTNSEPLSDVQTEAKPWRLTQWCRSASAHEVEVASAIGIASKNLVLLHTTESKYLWPRLWGKGPQTSTCMWEKRFWGTGNCPRDGGFNLFAFVLWQLWHVLTNSLICFFMAVQ